MKHILLLSFIFLFSALTQSAFGQLHWESLVVESDVFKYVTPASTLSSDWIELNYDDSSWSAASGGFGYGDNDDNTIVPTSTTSIYLRKTIDIPANLTLSQLVLDMDYDDGFVAYINGEEVARSSNVSAGTPSVSGSVTSDHEAQLYSGGIPTRFTLSPKVLIAGENILAVQVMNRSASSSDLSGRVFLSAEVDAAGILFNQTPDWFYEPVNMEYSNLPIFIIDTQGYPIVDDPKITAQLQVINNESGINYFDDDTFEYDGYIGIEVRGNSTSSFPKQPYAFETRDINGENLNVKLLGIPTENDWILRASYLDHTFIRNGLANAMSRETGYWASRTKHVEVVLNGEYQGIYLLMEKIKRDDDRLDIATLLPEDISGEELTGGYIWEVTGFESHFGENRKLKYPHIDDVQPEQLAYIQSIDDAFRNKMRQTASVYRNANTGYVQHIWVESFIVEMMIQEAMRNSDAYGWSGYYHKDKNGLINAGPVWDFDQSAGNSSYPDDGVVTGWMAEHPNTSSTPFYWPLLLNDPFFKYSMSLRWKELRAEKFSDKNLIAYVDSVATLLEVPVAREFSKWPVLGANVWRETSGYQARNTYQKEVDYLKSFLLQRWAWMDTQLANVVQPSGYPYISFVGKSREFEVYLSQDKVYLDLDELFSFPYDPDLKYKAYSRDTSIIKTDVKKSDSVRLKLKNMGACEVVLTAYDTYGNHMDATLSFHVVDDLLPIADVMDDYAPVVSVFPNPAAGQFTIQLENVESFITSVEVYNIAGKLEQRLSPETYAKQTWLNADKLANGVYLLRITTETGGTYTGHVMIRK